MIFESRIVMIRIQDIWTRTRTLSSYSPHLSLYDLASPQPSPDAPKVLARWGKGAREAGHIYLYNYPPPLWGIARCAIVYTYACALYIFCHSIFRQFPYFAVILPRTPNLSVCPEDAENDRIFPENIRFWPKLSDFTQNLPEFPRNASEFARNTRFGVSPYFLYLAIFFPGPPRRNIESVLYQGGTMHVMTSTTFKSGWFWLRRSLLFQHRLYVDF